MQSLREGRLQGRRFPTTLYGWRLQIAPKLAPELIVRGAEQVYTESALIGLSFAIVLLGVLRAPKPVRPAPAVTSIRATQH